MGICFIFWRNKCHLLRERCRLPERAGDAKKGAFYSICKVQSCFFILKRIGMNIFLSEEAGDAIPEEAGDATR